MLDFAALPPEVNSVRMYSGPGSGPLLAAAAAWNTLAAEMRSAATAYDSVVKQLLSAGWFGPSSTSMLAAAEPYLTWLNTTAAQAEQAGVQANAAASAFEAAFAMTVPPPVVAANRTLLANLVASNIFGQNTPAIAATDAEYAEMWAQDAAAMNGYSTASNSAAQITPFTSPRTNTTPDAAAGQNEAVNQAANSAAGNTQSLLSANTFAADAVNPAAAPQGPIADYLTGFLDGSNNTALGNFLQSNFFSNSILNGIDRGRTVQPAVHYRNGGGRDGDARDDIVGSGRLRDERGGRRDGRPGIQYRPVSGPRRRIRGGGQCTSGGFDVGAPELGVGGQYHPRSNGGAGEWSQ